jgi:hypothetical protein
MGIIGAIFDDLPPQYGKSVDGVITIASGTVNIKELYENENVTGVITENGIDKGLNYGLGSYDPDNGYFPQCIDFTINPSAVLSATAWAAGGDDTLGYIRVGCSRNFANNGQISANSLGGAGGYSVCGCENWGGAGYGPGGAQYNVGGICYDDLILSSFRIGSGGASGMSRGCSGSGGSACSGAGGAGGGKIYISATKFVTVGTITSNGSNGGNGRSTGGSADDSGSGGGGSGGSIKFESLTSMTITTSVQANGGNGGYHGYATNSGGGAGHLLGGYNSNGSGRGGAGSKGIIYIVNSYSGIVQNIDGTDWIYSGRTFCA